MTISRNFSNSLGMITWTVSMREARLLKSNSIGVSVAAHDEQHKPECFSDGEILATKMEPDRVSFG